MKTDYTIPCTGTQDDLIFFSRAQTEEALILLFNLPYWYTPELLLQGTG